MRLETAPLPSRIPLDPSAGRADIGVFVGCPELIGSPFTYAREEEIFGQGEEAEYVYKIVSGAVRTCRILADGRRQINGFQVPGDLLGLEADATHRLTAEAVSDTTVLLLKRRQVEKVAAANAAIACKLWGLTAQSLRRAEDHMMLLGRRNALERVAAFLLDLDRRLGGTGLIELPMSRRDIADYLGLTLETVSRSVSQLQVEHALTLSGARRLVLHKARMNRVVED